MNSVKKNFIYNSIYQLLILFIPLITTPYISRTLGPTGVGIYSYGFSVAKYYGLFIILGLANYGNRAIAQNRDNGKLRNTFWGIYYMQFIIGIFVTCIYFIYSFLLADNKNVALIMSLYVISNVLDISWLFFGLEEFKYTVFRNIVVKIVTTVSIFVFVKDINDTLVYCFILSFGFILSQIILWPAALKKVPFYRPTIKEITVHIKPNLLLFMTVLAVSIYRTMDKIMLGLMVDKTQVGYYESAERIINIPLVLVSSLGTVMLPRVSNIVAKNGTKSNENSLLQKSIIFALFLSSSMCFGIMAVSREFVPWFYGSGYEPCVSIFIIIFPSCLFLAYANVIRTQYLLPHNLDKIYLTSTILGAVSNLVINYLLIPKYLANGAAIGTLIAEMVVCLYQAIMIRKFVPVGKYALQVLPFIISGFIMFIIDFTVTIPVSSNFLGMLIKIVIGIILYFSTLMVLLLLFGKKLDLPFKLRKKL